MKYTIREMTKSGAVVDFADGSWANVPMLDTDIRADFELRVSQYAPVLPASNPSWAVAGLEGSVVTKTQGEEGSGIEPESAVEEVNPLEAEWLDRRIQAYGPVATQIEFITENGLAAWQEEVAAIKKNFPITEE